MKKITKVMLALVMAIVALTVFTTKSNAMTANELKDYICNDKGINGTKLIIRDADKVKVEKFFANNEMTDAQADQIKAIIDKGVALMNADGASEPNQLSSKAKKQELLSYAQEAAAVMGLTVSYDATEERLDIYKNGVLYDSLNWGVTESSKGSTESALVQTGSTNYVYIVVAGIMLIAGIMLVISRKKRLSAEAK
ncbi:MAG TPA: LPXTG cell wall anchor domain-containing protein [Clostridiaceae bacterium]|jgi:LPXTG-motif cell wall-anchored protein|nr:LPXTG cell wall anchor domain-containing protein [Clostridiaceae bacterium]